MKTTQIIALLFLSVILPKILRGQEREDFTDYGSKIAIKFSPMAALNPFEPTLAFSLEHRIIGKHYLEHELGYVYQNPWLMPKELRGLRYRLGYHYVTEENIFGYKYIGVQFHYRQLFGEIEEFLWRKGYSYQQKTKYQNTMHSYGFTLMYGKVRFIGNSTRWFTDYQIGMGLSWKPFEIENYPVDAENPNYVAWMYNSRSFINDGTALRNGENPKYINFLFALKIGYKIY
jgi:hypothetical protein